MYKIGLKLWSTNTDDYYDEAIRLYNDGVFDYIELYVVPDTLDTLQKWKKLRTLAPCGRGQGEGLNLAPSPLVGGATHVENFQDDSIASSPLVGEGWGEGLIKATHFYSRQSLEYSKELRKNLTKPEQILWHFLRNRQLNNMKFRRQEAIGEYIADFVCYERKVIVELDGGGHVEQLQKEHDIKRDNFLRQNGFKVITIFNNDVYENIERVLEYIIQETPHPSPLPQGAREHGIPFIIHCPHFAHGFNLAKKEKKESNKKIFKQVQRFADELNAKYIIFHGGIDGTIEETAKQLASFNEPRALIENKPFVALPNKMGGEFCRGYNPDEIRLIKEIAKCGFCLDFGHAICSANSQGKDIYEYCREFLQFEPGMFHLTDNKDITSPYDTHLHLGTGTLDIDKIKEILPNDAIVTLETDKDSKKNLNDFIGDAQWMRK